MDHKWLSRLKPTAVPKPFRGLRVLLVDNDTTSLLYIASVLEQQFYKVRTTEVASVALYMLGEQPDQFDVVMADLNLPEMDSFELLRQIQLIREDIPIILMSSKIEMEMEMEMVWKTKREGACFVLEKPISAEHLKNIWQHVYRKRRCQMMENRYLVAVVVDAEKEVTSEMSEKHKEIDEEVNSVSVATETDKPPQGSKRKWTEDEDGGERRSDLEELEHSYTKGGLKAIDVVERHINNDRDNGSTEKRSRFSWTPDLHVKFIQVTTALGPKEARPKKVMEMMNVPNLTQRQVASHLQKYRGRIQRDSDTTDHATLPPFAPSNICGGNGPLQLQVQHNSDDYAFEALHHLPEYAFLAQNPCSNRADSFRFQAAFSTSREGKQPLQFKDSTENFASSINSVHSSQVPPSVYDDMMKILEGEEEVEDFNGKLARSDVDRYCEWLGTHLLGSGCSSDQNQSKELNSDKNSRQ